ncbi:hypothetical protein PoB_000175600 [Plakobranchus ocellatus]|uniref:DDE Tnp4 domain-containing protein n=1 Tax=Plakobranchus ocellatus TaxID=259542 RepID=A0AAV3XYV4_9GAST|nr:hypothetical protein PoB_000175600 [Plakobranchus ocellatus]
MFHESGIITTLEETMNRPDGTPLCLHCDPAYPLRPHVMKPFMGARLTREQEEFNENMSRVRISVEWGFGKISNLFAFVDLKKNLKLYLQPVGKIFLVATIVANSHLPLLEPNFRIFQSISTIARGISFSLSCPLPQKPNHIIFSLLF